MFEPSRSDILKDLRSIRVSIWVTFWCLSVEGKEEADPAPPQFRIGTGQFGLISLSVTGSSNLCSRDVGTYINHEAVFQEISVSVCKFDHEIDGAFLGIGWDVDGQ